MRDKKLILLAVYGIIGAIVLSLTPPNSIPWIVTNPLSQLEFPGGKSLGDYVTSMFSTILLFLTIPTLITATILYTFLANLIMFIQHSIFLDRTDAILLFLVVLPFLNALVWALPAYVVKVKNSKDQ